MDGAKYTPRCNIIRCHLENFSPSDVLASANDFTGVLVKNQPNIPPAHPATTSCPCLAPAATIPSINFCDLRSSSVCVPGTDSFFKVSIPARMANGFPDNVPAWYIGPAGATISMISLRPPYAPTGKPPPITFPMVVTSGVTPKYSCAPPYATRNPVMTSSKTNRAPYSFANSRRPTKNSLSGLMKPELPTTGSNIIAATSSLFSSKIALTESKLLYSAQKVDCVAALGTPGESGNPNVATPDPACTKNESA